MFLILFLCVYLYGCLTLYFELLTKVYRLGDVFDNADLVDTDDD